MRSNRLVTALPFSLSPLPFNKELNFCYQWLYGEGVCQTSNAQQCSSADRARMRSYLSQNSLSSVPAGLLDHTTALQRL